MHKYSTIQDLEDNRQEWLKRLQSGDEQMLKVLYKHFRSDFVRWVKSKTSCSETEALDMFQDSIVALYHNVQKGTLVSFEKSIRAYLFTIGKYIYYRKSKKKKQIQMTSFEDAGKEVNNLVDTPDVSALKNEQQRLILALLKKMKEPCKSILELFYYQNSNLKEIATQLNYGSANVVKVQKARCMNRLRAAAEKIKKSKE